MKKPNWIVFDVGGVLLDWPTSSQAVADYLGVSKIQLFDTLFDQTVPVSIGAQMNVGELSTSEGWRIVLSRLSETTVTPEEVLSRWCDRSFWYVDTLKLIRELKEAGYKLAIMSNSWLGLTDPEMKDVFPAELQPFDHIFDSSIEKMKKPDVAFYELVENGLQAFGEEIYFIDDDQKNILTADRRGWQTHLFESPNNNPAQSNAAIRKSLVSQA